LQEDPILTMLQDNEDNRLVDQHWLINDVLSVYASDNNAATANDFANEETTLLNDGDVCQMLSQYFVDINHLDVFLINQMTTVSMIFYPHSKVVHTTTMNQVHTQYILSILYFNEKI